MNGLTKDDIIRMAREAGASSSGISLIIGIEDFFERFAALVAATEREACAKEISAEINDEIEDEAYCILVALLARIRARGQQENG
jgi:hypothetical protein